MSRRAKGPRLYLREGRTGRAAVWVIRDSSVERSTGFPADRLGEAERDLAAYIAAKWTPEAGAAIRNRRDPDQIGIDEVLALYAMERAPHLMSDAKSTAGFIAHLNGWWRDMRLSEIKRSTCQAYVAHRTAQPIRHGKTGRLVSDQAARRELETLSAAVGYWHGEDPLVTRPRVWLPEKPESPRDAITRDEAARLLRAAMGWRLAHDSGEDGPARWRRLGASARANRKHLRRFILIGLYTGTRHTAIKALLWHESPTQAWVDLDKGMIYRRGRRERQSATKRRPVVKIPPRLLAHMRRWKRLDEGRGDASVIHHGAGPIAGKIRRGFAACVRDGGLRAEITPHWMRHTCATWLMEGGAELWDAAAYTGMTTAVLEKHYGHHRPDHQKGALRAIGGKRSGPRLAPE